jgi:hypothetical protein
MKRWQLVGAGVLGFLVLCMVQAGPAWGGRGQGFRPCPYTPYVCPIKGTCKPFDAQGKVVQVLTETLEETMYPGLAITMATKDHGQVRVHLGPVWYLERQEFELNPGDEVRVTGMSEKEKDGMMQVTAYELSKGNYVLSLRDSQGRPNWEAWRKVGD